MSGKVGMAIDVSSLRAAAIQLFFGKPINFEMALSDAKNLNIINLSNSRVKLTDLGAMFVSLNIQQSFEANSEQKRMLSENLAAMHISNGSGGYRRGGQPVRGLECPHSDEPLYILDDAGLAEISAASKLVSKNGMSESELETHLAETRLYGAVAEEFVLAWEIKRLKDLGMVKEADFVRRVGNLDVTLGYDIESFTLRGGTPDRFIEVKCTKTPFLKFYWSRNEVEQARRLGDKYFIYFVWLNSEGKPEGNPEIIENPSRTVFEDKDRFSVSFGTIVVSGV